MRGGLRDGLSRVLGPPRLGRDNRGLVGALAAELAKRFLPSSLM